MLSRRSVSSRRGQAVVELLPAVLIFLLVTTAAMTYFRTLRHATLRQEVVRNLAFAKIANSGTLTTPTEQSGGELPVQYAASGERSVAGIQASANAFVSNENVCFRIVPHEPTTEVSLSGVYGMGDLVKVPFSTSSVVYRGALGQRVAAACGP